MMKKIIVTPAGRKKYLEILHKNLHKCRDEFDEWVIWVNTDNSEDKKFIELLPKTYDYVRLQYSEVPVDPNGSHTATICKFFEKCIDENTVYLRLDDDIVFIEKNSIKNLFEFRMANEQYFLVFGNILNNALITHVYQQRNIVTNLPHVTYNCEDENGWRDGHFAVQLHNIFLDKAYENKTSDFFMDNWILSNFERCSINSISWLGKTFKTFNGQVGSAEEIWLSSDKPKELNTPNIIFGKSLFSHYAFSPQRPTLQNTNILERYSKL